MVRLHKVPTPPEHRGKSRRFYLYECACGNQVIRRGDAPGKTCCKPGCTYASYMFHGRSETRLYAIWKGIKARCILKHPSNIYYKDKGIKLDPNWLHFNIFEEWALAHGYNDTLTIDRIDIDGDYTPSNCEWVTLSENVKRLHRDRRLFCKPTKVNNINFGSAIDASKYVAKSLQIKPASVATYFSQIKETDFYFRGFHIQRM